MMPHPDYLPETPEIDVNKHFALSSELISELLLEMRLRGVQYRRYRLALSLVSVLAIDRAMPIFTTLLWERLCFVQTKVRFMS